MQILVDADACPVVGIVEKIASEYKIPVVLLCDTNHVLVSDYSEVIVVGAGADAEMRTWKVCKAVQADVFLMDAQRSVADDATSGHDKVKNGT